MYRQITKVEICKCIGIIVHTFITNTLRQGNRMKILESLAGKGFRS